VPSVNLTATPDGDTAWIPPRLVADIAGTLFSMVSIHGAGYPNSFQVQGASILNQFLQLRLGPGHGPWVNIGIDPGL
jgi:hypothetical protein